MSLATSSTRPSSGTSFEHNPMFNNRNQARSHHTQHGVPPSTQFFQIPPTPAVEPVLSTRSIPIPATPGIPLMQTKKVEGMSSPGSGYFGLSKNDNDTQNTNNWSAASSLRSTAARSPMVIDMDTVPFPSDDFKRQNSAMAFNLSLGKGKSMNTTTSLENKQENTQSKPKPQSPNNYFNTDPSNYIQNNDISNQYNIPRYGSPTPMDTSKSPPPPSKSLSGGINLTLPVKIKGPVCGDVLKTKGGNSRSFSLPESSKVDGLSLMYGARLVNILENSPKDILLLDLRPYQAYATSRIHGSLNIAIPTTLLKRPTFNIAKIMDCLGTAAMKEQLSRWKETKFIVAYDGSSTKVQESPTASFTVGKFVREGWTGEAFLLSGGLEDFEEEFPQKVDTGSVEEDPKTAKSVSSSTKTGSSMKPTFSCALPASKNVCNPFFSNIRQNMDLIGGVGEMSIALPPNTTDNMKKAFPKWIRAMACEDGGSKKVGEKFYNIEKAEQTRMQQALNCQVTYDTCEKVQEKSHTLAGVEKGAKNRYNNIWPYEHTRVKLKGHEKDECDYVNASFVSTEYSSKRYIATQGPLPSTFKDFWSVVWDQDIRVIVMLTAESEGGQLKCHSYWGDNSYGPYNLSSLSERRVTLDPAKTNPALRKSVDKNTNRPSASARKQSIDIETSLNSDAPHVIMRKFTLSHSSHPFSPIREITQLQYSSWPDFGAPADPAHILGLIEQTDAVVRSCAPPSRPSTFRGSLEKFASKSTIERPILVHCSAGCGRTGTFCTADSVIDMLKHQKDELLYPNEKTFDASGEPRDWLHDESLDLIEKAVIDFRDQRLSMVQSLRQYVLCYETVLEWLVRRPLTESPNINWSRLS